MKMRSVVKLTEKKGRIKSLERPNIFLLSKMMLQLFGVK